jgi:ComEC/Rec2-related protein
MVALMFAGGIVLADVSPILPPVFALLGISAALATLALAWPRGRPVLVWVLLVSAGATNLARNKAVLSPHDLRIVAGGQPVIVALRGTLSETPYHRIYEHKEEETWRTLAAVDVTDIRLKNGAWRPASGRIAVSTPGVLSPDLFGGRQVEVDGVLGFPREPIVEGVFDYRKFLIRQGIYFQLQVSSTNDWRLAPDAARVVARPTADRFGDWAKAALARGLPVEDEPLRLLWAMTLGWKTALSGEVSEPFMRTGTMHVFAISGLHIALIAGLLVLLFQVLRVPRAWCGWVVIPLIWFYTGVTGWQASAIRSTIMMSVIIAGWALRRPADLINSLAAAAFIILLWDPQQLFQAGFQLSFVVVFSLALFTPLIGAFHAPLSDPDPTVPLPPAQRIVRRVPFLRMVFPDPLLPAELRSAWQRWLGIPLRWLFNAGTTSLAAWLGSIPLIAYYFHLITPIGLLANLVIVPLSSVALACNMASLAVSALVPAAAELFNHAGWFFMWLMVRLSEWAAQTPGGCFHIAAPSFAGFTFYYTLLVSVLGGWLFRPKLRLWAGGGLVVLGILCFSEWQAERRNARLTVIPLNGGEAAYFKPARSSEDLLIDCGNESSADFVLKPFLRAQGVNRLAKLLLTHGDIHSVGGARLISERFPPRKVLFSQISFRSGAYRSVVDHFSKTPGLAEIMHRGDRVDLWMDLHPDESDRFTQSDDSSVVLRGEIEGVRVLLLSDLGKRGQNALMNRSSDLRADIVVSGLPNQSEPLADALLDALQPQLVVITDSEYPASQRASTRLRERLAAHNVPVLYTRETGGITMTLAKGRWTARPMSGSEISGFARRGP